MSSWLILLLCFVIFIGFILLMSVGLIKNKRVQGSCGGLSTLGIEKVCDCEQPCDQKKRKMAVEEITTL